MKFKYNNKVDFWAYAKTGLSNLRWIFTQSRGVLGLIHKVLCMKKLIEVKKYHFGRIVPAFFLTRLKYVKFGVKMLKIEIFPIFQLWHLKTLNFSSSYHFQVFFTIFRPFLRKDSQISEIGLILLIFKELALAKPKQVPEPNGTCHMASFRMHFDHTT